MAQSYTRRAYGCAVIKSVNSNYNADFTHQPRTLPDGTVYATDKALKYSIRYYLTKFHEGEKVFFFKRQNERNVPNTLSEMYDHFFGPLPKITKTSTNKKTKTKKSSDGEVEGAEARKIVIANLLSCLDIRLFGATFAPKATNVGGKKNADSDAEPDDAAGQQGDNKGLSLSIHGPVQITHAVNRYKEGAIFSEQIMSPFRNPEPKSYESTQTTLGTQVRLNEGHYVHHFSVNPQNLAEHLRQIGNNALGLTTDDIVKLKEALRSGVTFYDSASKAGTENELLLWVELKESSKLVLPSLIELVDIKANKESREIDLSKVNRLLSQPHIKEHIDKIEIYYRDGTEVSNVPANAEHLPL